MRSIYLFFLSCLYATLAFAQSPQNQMDPAQKLYLFGTDVVYFLKEYTDACKTGFCEDRLKNLHALYKTHDHLKESQKLLGKWTDFPTPMAERCRCDLQEGIDSLIASNKLLMKIHRAETTEPLSDIALAQAKWEKGKERIRRGLNLFPRVLFYFDGDPETSPANYYKLTNHQQQALRETIQQLFKSELSQKTVSPEILSLVIIDHYIETHQKR